MKQIQRNPINTFHIREKRHFTCKIVFITDNFYYNFIANISADNVTNFKIELLCYFIFNLLFFDLCLKSWYIACPPKER